jgi:hypothetical protein
MERGGSKGIEKKLEAIDKNAFRGFEEKSTWTIWRDGEKYHRLIDSLKKVVMGARVPMVWTTQGQIWCQGNMD